MWRISLNSRWLQSVLENWQFWLFKWLLWLFTLVPVLPPLCLFPLVMSTLVVVKDFPTTGVHGGLSQSDSKDWMNSHLVLIKLKEVLYFCWTNGTLCSQHVLTLTECCATDPLATVWDRRAPASGKTNINNLLYQWQLGLCNWKGDEKACGMDCPFINELTCLPGLTDVNGDRGEWTKLKQHFQGPHLLPFLANFGLCCIQVSPPGGDSDLHLPTPSKPSQQRADQSLRDIVAEVKMTSLAGLQSQDN